VTPTAIDQLLDDLADRIVDRLAGRMRSEMNDQAASPLGRRRHIGMVRRLHAAGDPGVAIVGRRYLATRAVIEQELGLIGRRPAEVDDTEAELARELGLRIVGGQG
jgi:hypothetical protein